VGTKAITTEDEIIDVFTAAGLKKPDNRILSPQFLAEVRGFKYKNVAAEILVGGLEILDCRCGENAPRLLNECDERSARGRSAFELRTRFFDQSTRHTHRSHVAGDLLCLLGFRHRRGLGYRASNRLVPDLLNGCRLHSKAYQ